MTHPPLTPLSPDVLAFQEGRSFHCTRCGVNVSEPGRRCVECAKIRSAEGPGDWREDAACQIEYPESFFPLGWGSGYTRQIAEAKAICATCPVIDECLAWALDSRDGHAILGGTTPDERANMRRREYRLQWKAARAAERQAVSAP